MNKQGEGTGSDEFFLNFGSSTNVCDQLRHGIREEITEIDASIATIQNDASKEERNAKELQKSLSHSSKEMYNLYRSAKDCVESSTMNETLRFRMMEELTQELLDPYLDGKGKEKESNDMKNNTGSSDSQNSASYFENYRKLVIDAHSSAKSTKDKILAMLDEKRQLEEEKQSIETLIKTENLQEKQISSKLDLDNLVKEQEKERQRLMITRDAVYEARSKSADYAKEIAENTKILTEKRVEQEEERKKLAEVLAKEEEELHKLESDTSLEKKFDDISNKVELLVKQKTEFVALRNKRNEKRMLLKKIEDEIRDLNVSEAQKQLDLETAKENLMSAKKENEEANLYREQVLAQKAHNDHIEKEKIMPGRAESQELQKAKETIAKNISIVDIEREQQLKELKDKLDNQSNSLSNLENEVRVASSEFEKTNSALADIKKARDELQKNTLREAQESKNMKDGFNEACHAEKIRLRDLESEMKANFEAKVREARDLSYQKRIQEEEWLEVLKRGSILIKEVRAREREVETLKADRDSFLGVM